MEREQGQLEEHARQEQGQSDNGHGLVGERPGLVHQLGDVGGVLRGHDVGQAIQGQGRGHRAEQDVLDARLGRALVFGAQGQGCIHGVGGELQGQVDGDQLHRGGEHHQAERGETEQHVVVGPLALFQGRLARRVEHGHVEAERDGDLEELGHEVHFVDAPEHLAVQVEAGDGHEERGAGTERQPTLDRRFPLPRTKRLDHQSQHQGEEEQLRDKCGEVEVHDLIPLYSLAATTPKSSLAAVCIGWAVSTAATLRESKSLKSLSTEGSMMLKNGAGARPIQSTNTAVMVR